MTVQTSSEPNTHQTPAVANVTSSIDVQTRAKEQPAVESFDVLQLEEYIVNPLQPTSAQEQTTDVNASATAQGDTEAAPTQFDKINLKQAQDSPDHSLFSYSIGEFLTEGDEASSVEAAQEAMSDDVKAKLQEILPLLDQDITILVQDTESIRSLYRQVKGQLPVDIATALILVAFIESRQP